MRFIALLLPVGTLPMLTACTGDSSGIRQPSSVTSFPPDLRGSQLSSAVDAINKAAGAKGYALHTLTMEKVLAWFDEAKDFELLRGERARPWEQLRQGVLPDAGTAGRLAVPEVPSPSSGPPASGADEQGAVVGTTSYGFELNGPEDGGHGSAQIVITPFNLPIVDGNGYVPYKRYLESLLKPDLDLAREPFAGTPVPAGSAPLDPDVRVRVTPTVVKGRAKADPAQRDALKVEICLTADTLDEAAQLLMNHYCLLGADVAPAFGDYLSVPNQHAGRYVLRDPATGRDVSFSVQSGGTVPYRLAWLTKTSPGRRSPGRPTPASFGSVSMSGAGVARRCVPPCR